MFQKEGVSDDISKPYPFCLANPLDSNTSELGAPSRWLVEWKYDGIRAQVIKRNGEVFIWSRGEEIINNQFGDS